MKFNSIAQSSLVVLSLLLTVAGAHAQSPTRANVPFAFKVGTTQMPSRHLQRPERIWHRPRHGPQRPDRHVRSSDGPARISV